MMLAVRTTRDILTEIWSTSRTVEACVPVAGKSDGYNCINNANDADTHLGLRHQHRDQPDKAEWSWWCREGWEGVLSRVGEEMMPMTMLVMPVVFAMWRVTGQPALV